MSSLVTNVILNYLNTLSGIIFPIITFPYAARVLQAEGIGAINFQLSIVNYILLFTSLGIPLYAVKEVAQFRDDITQRNRLTVEILLLSLLLSVVGYIAVVILGECIPQIHSRLAIFYILSLTLLFTSIGVNWFYQAIEDFKFITIRGLIIRTLSALSLFLFVKTSGDLIIYACVVVASTVGNNVINFIHLRHYISISEIKWKSLKVFRHLKPAIHIFILNLIISLYVNLDSVMLGFISGEKSVGMYSAGVKLSHVVLLVVTSLGAVMLPRCSNLIQNGKTEEFAAITQKSLRLIWGLSLPFTFGLILLARPIIEIFCGHEFSRAVPVLCWTSPIVIFAGLTNLTGIQILYPQNKENIVIWSTAGGAAFNMTLNFILIPIWAELGAAISTFITEAVVLLIQFVWGRRYMPFSLFSRDFLKYLSAVMTMSIVIYGLCTFIHSEWLLLISGILAGGGVYIIALHIMKDPLLDDVWSYVRSFTRKQH